MKSGWLEPNLTNGTNSDARSTVKCPKQYELASKEAWTLQNQTTKKERCSNIKLPCFLESQKTIQTVGLLIRKTVNFKNVFTKRIEELDLDLGKRSRGSE